MFVTHAAFAIFKEELRKRMADIDDKLAAIDAAETKTADIITNTFAPAVTGFNTTIANLQAELANVTLTASQQAALDKAATDGQTLLNAVNAVAASLTPPAPPATS